MSKRSLEDLQATLEKLPPTRAKRILAFAHDMARDAVDVQSIASLRQQCIDLQSKVETPHPKIGKLFSSREAWAYVSVSERTFRDYVGAGLIRPMNPDALNGEHYRFSKLVLDEFLQIPSGKIRTSVSMYRRRKARESKIIREKLAALMAPKPPTL